MKLIGKLVCSISLGIAAVLSTNLPIQAAQNIRFVYGPFIKTVRISSLENFVHTGEINQNIEFFFRSTTPEQRKEFRQILTKKIPFNGVVVSRFLNSSLGKAILEKFGYVITLPRGGNGKILLRSAIVKAALDPEGLTLINTLRNLPTDIQIDVENLLRVHKAIKEFLASTNEAVKSLQVLSKKEAATDKPVDFSKMQNLTKLGPYTYQKETWQLKDNSRRRSFYVIIYKPKVPQNQKIPVIVISHGLASRPEDFSQDAMTLASYGFLVALPQHPGSDLQHLNDFLKGFSREVFEVQEFINRPKDISFVIDELERRNQREYQGQLNLKQVGVIGHSFGGYTALAVGGAQIDFDNLKKACNRVGYINVSSLLQCSALELPREEYKLADLRVTAIMARNSLNSSIFGKNGLQKVLLPTIFTGGSFDMATPVVHEQMFSFPFLINTPESYLGLIEGETHTDLSQLDAGVSNLIESVADVILPSPELIRAYNNAISVAFFKVYIVSDNSYLPFLQSSYGVYLSQNQEFEFSLLTDKSKAAVSAEVERIRSHFVLGR